MEITISPRRVVIILVCMALCLTLVSVVVQVFRYSLDRPHLLGFGPQLDVDREGNIPTWFSSGLLLLCSLLLAGIGFASRPGGGYAAHWKILSLIFLYISLDEATAIHERTIAPLSSALNTGGIFYFAWIIPGAAFVLIFALAYLRFLLYLAASTRRLFLIAGGLFVAGSLGMEMLGGGYLSAYDRKDVAYALMTSMEELLEMVGLVVFIYALLAYISPHTKLLRIRAGERGAHPYQDEGGVVEKAGPRARLAASTAAGPHTK